MTEGVRLRMGAVVMAVAHVTFTAVVTSFPADPAHAPLFSVSSPNGHRTSIVPHLFFCFYST